MKENSIKEDIKTMENIIKSYIEADQCGLSNNDFKCEIQALSNILSDYKRVLKENEELKNKKEKTIKKIGQFSKKAETLPYDYDYLNGVSDVIKIVEENL